jgi:WhiB family redox-sensing transcriptional regulator
MTERDDWSLVGVEVLSIIAERLTPWRSASNDALAVAVIAAGACLDDTCDGDRPGWLFDHTTERELAALICADCPVSDACLELELRLFGAARLGMWGPLGEDGRRALHPVWVRAREDAATPEVGVTDDERRRRGRRGHGEDTEFGGDGRVMRS